MKKLIYLFFAVVLAASCRAQSPGIPIKTAGIVYSKGVPQWVPQLKSGSEIDIDTTTGHIYQWHRTNNSWLQLGQGIDQISGAMPPLYTPVRNMSLFAINGLDELYHYSGSAWTQINQGEVYTAGTGIDITGNEISNTGDLSNTNELQTISTGTNTLTLSNSGGTVTVDTDPTNEIELPSQAGNSGKYLTTNGSAVSWGIVTAGLGYSSIATNQIPYGNGTSAVTSTSTFKYDPSTGRLGVGTASPSTPLHVKAPASKNEVATFEWTTTPGGAAAKLTVDAIWNDRVRIAPTSTGSETGSLILLSNATQQLQIVDSNRKIALTPYGITLIAYATGAGAAAEQATVTPWSVRGQGGQTANLVKYENYAGTLLSGITNLGAFSPPQMTDASAANNTIYYSTTLSKLVYKDPGGTVNALY